MVEAVDGRGIVVEKVNLGSVLEGGRVIPSISSHYSLTELIGMVVRTAGKRTRPSVHADGDMPESGGLFSMRGR